MIWYTTVISLVAISILLVLPDTMQTPSDVALQGLASIETHQSGGELDNTPAAEPVIAYTYIPAIHDAQRLNTEIRDDSMDSESFQLKSALMATPKLVLQMGLAGWLGPGASQPSGALDSVTRQIELLRTFSGPVDSPLRVAQGE